MTKTKLSFAAVAVLAAMGVNAKELPSIVNKPQAPVRATTSNTVIQSVDNGARVKTVISNHGENHVLRVSSTLPTLLITPFANPSFWGNASRAESGNQEAYEGDFVASANGPNIMIQPERRTTVVIMDKDNPNATPFSLTLIPVSNLPSQSIVLSLGGRSVHDRARGTTGMQQSDYVAKVNADISEIIQGRIPTGYSVRPLGTTVPVAAGFRVQPVEMYSSYASDVYRYRITNHSGVARELVEEPYGQDSLVQAVTIFPQKLLQPGQSTDLIIMRGKQ